jgi:pimeloyl-ACP methyl ester carboxylesterase
MRRTIFVNAMNLSAVAPWFLLCVVLSLSGCTLLGLQRNISEIDRSIVLAGRALAPPDSPGNVIVLVYKQTSHGNEIVDFQYLDSDGYYLFLVAPGQRYYLAAFLDTNNNLRYESGEPVGYYGQPTAISESMEDSDNGATIYVSADTTFPAQFPLDLGAASIIGNKNIPLIFGEIITLDDQRLSREWAKKSLWAPLDFAKQNGIGIFFLEEYDPKKIPILFVHGFGGTPLDWEAIINSVDRRCYQPWLFYYPAGVRLYKSEKLMSVVLGYFKKQYDFSDLYIVAHSMGGLIARSYIVNSASHSERNSIKLLVTFSTPWNGHSAAAQGVNNSPVVMPAWIDIQPDSRFIRSMFDAPVDSPVDHYLFFSFDDSKSASGMENDGAVTLASQLDYRAQSGATKMFGINVNHRNILRDEGVLTAFNAILSNATAANKNQPIRHACASGN